ncbi:MAG: TonB-dependent receptor family protein [Hyphomicrobium sp.]
MRFIVLVTGLVIGLNAVAVTAASAQQTNDQPAPAAAPPAGAPATAAPAGEQPSSVPEVEVIQKKEDPPPAQAAEEPAPKPKKKVTSAPKKPAPKPVAAPAPPPPAPEPEQADFEPPAPTEPAVTDPNPVYGAANSRGAAARAEQSAQPPINPTQLVPSNLDGFSSSATNIDPEALKQSQPRNINEVFTQVPGVIVINDDAAAHHGGIGIRGSPPRRSRKILVMEDGHPVNLALWLDPSVHYFAPIDRIEDFEVLRGTVIVHGPNNNFGIINARNLSPFGRDETVVSSAIGFTENDTGFFLNEDDEAITGTNDTDISARWHFHTRQTVGNVGMVFSYTGHNTQGTWDTERLRANDFYGALGFKGQSSDLTVSYTYARQRDNYDEANFTGDDDDPAGAAERGFFDTKHCHTCFAPGSVFDTYNGDVHRSQVVHNAYLDDDTTLTTRIYGQHHVRDRYQIVTTEDNPVDAEQPGVAPVFVPDGNLFEIVLPQDSMFGRLRTFRHLGAESRLELANRPFFAGMTQDIQVGARYEYQDMTNRNFLGLSGEILEEGDDKGLTIFKRDLQADTFSAFLQTSVKVTSDFSVVPGVRFEYYKVKRQSAVTAEEEGEAEEEDSVNDDPASPCGDNPAIDPDEECLVIEGINRTPFNDSFSQFHTLPGIAFAYNGLFKTTVFGGYHRGMSTGVLRNEDFPIEDEIGDNFQLGVRSSAVRGFQFEVAGFYQRIHDFQFGASFSSAGDRSFGKAELVEIEGVEMAGRVDTHPYTGGPLNVFGAANYTYSEATITSERVFGVNFRGNDVPEVPFTTAALTAGIESKAGWRWDASATWTYRSAFFTDEFNTPFGGDPEGENGEVPEQWLLSARINLDIGETGATVFVSGDNLLDEFYIADREDGLKPGQGRTIWTGFKYTFD